jgi:hypothetical protein
MNKYRFSGFWVPEARLAKYPENLKVGAAQWQR